MSSRLFMSIVFMFSSQLANADLMVPSAPVIDNNRLIIEANDAGEVISVPVDDKVAAGEEFLLNLVGFFDFKKSFETVLGYLTPTLEDANDVFILVNVAYETKGSPDDFIPSQHMRVLKRSDASGDIFTRNKQGQITGIADGVLGAGETGAIKGLSGLMKVSSGASQNSKKGDPHVDTITGLYRVNHEKSAAQRYGKGMYHSLYYDLIYAWDNNRVSGIAVHGTSKDQYKYLGTQKSHGCMRTSQDVANALYEHVILNKNMRDSVLPDMDRTLRLKSELYDSAGNLKVREGTKALMIIFYGYNDASVSI